MPNVASGVSEAGAEENVNSDAGFEAALARKGVEPEVGETTTDTSVSAGLEVAEPEDQPRSPEGRFAPKETVVEEPETSDVDDGVDPLVAEYLAKYNGDPDAAIKAAAHQQNLIGEQGNKLGQQAERVARLEGQLETLLATQKSPQSDAPTLSGDEVDAKAYTLIEAKGYHEAATEAANYKLSTGDDRLYGAIIDQWSLESGYQASKHVADFTAWERTQNLTPSAPDAWVEDQKGAQQMGNTIKALAAERGDGWSQIAPHMEQALDDLPADIAKLVASPDSALSLAGARIVADRAMFLAAQSGQPAEVATTPEPKGNRKLAGAQVASGALRPAPKAPSGSPQSVQEATVAFKEAIMGADTTSVASGLTYGK